MKFLLLMAEENHFDNWEHADAALRERVAADFEIFTKAVAERGAILVGEALADPASARTVSPGADRVVTDGPFAETVEQLGGLYVIDVPDLDTAVDLARLLPQEYAVEVREILEVDG